MLDELSELETSHEHLLTGSEDGDLGGFLENEAAASLVPSRHWKAYTRHFATKSFGQMGVVVDGTESDG